METGKFRQSNETLILYSFKKIIWLPNNTKNAKNNSNNNKNSINFIF